MLKKLWVGVAVVSVSVVTAGTATAAAARPDLVQTAVSKPPADVAAGLRFTARDTVVNRGASRAAKSKTGYYLSLDRARGKGDIALGARDVPRLPAGKRSHGQRLLTVPPSTPLRLFYLLACADHGKRIRESGEGNNCRASASRILVRAPSCREQLGLRGVGFAPGPAAPGVADPVTVQLPLEGVVFTAFGSPATALFMDCSLVLPVRTMATGLAAAGIASVNHVGTYNYRCVGGQDPDTHPGCVLSEHARGRAIDFASFSGGGVTYDVKDDWVIDLGSGQTCSAPTENAKDEFLHELVCGWFGAGLFNIILTPNYNAAHRDHFHVDVTPDAAFIE